MFGYGLGRRELFEGIVKIERKVEGMWKWIGFVLKKKFLCLRWISVEGVGDRVVIGVDALGVIEVGWRLKMRNCEIRELRGYYYVYWSRGKWW